MWRFDVRNVFALVLTGPCALGVLIQHERAGSLEPSISVSSAPLAAGAPWAVNVSWPLLPSGCNPFDPTALSVNVAVTVVGGPGAGTPASVFPSAWFQDFNRSLSPSGSEILDPTGAPHFAARIVAHTPNDVVDVDVVVAVGSLNSPCSALGSATWPAARNVSVAPPDADAPLSGFVTAEGSTGARPYFRVVHPPFANATSTYFPVGENVAWANNIGQPTGRGTFSFDRWFAKLSTNGANYARIWLGGMFDSFNLETATTGLGVYDLEAAWRIAYVLRLAERHGIRLLISFLSFNGLRSTAPFDLWTSNAYNRANGGMLDAAEEWFTDPAAFEHFSRRVRYVVALTAASPATFAFEWFNEVDLTDNFDGQVPAVLAWHVNATAMLRSELGGGLLGEMRPVTTSFSRSEGVPAIDAAPFMSYTQTHAYGASDMAADVISWCSKKRAAYAKPTIVAEYGLDDKQPFKYDRGGLELQNGLWAAVSTTACAGTPMIWWWDTVVDPLDWYHLFRGPAAMVWGVELADPRVSYSEPSFTGAPAQHRVLSRVPSIAANGVLGSLYIQNLNATWSAAGEHNATIVPTAPFSLTLDWCPDDATSLSFIFVDPVSGDGTGTSLSVFCDHTAHTAVIDVPAFTGAIAAAVFINI